MHKFASDYKIEANYETIYTNIKAMYAYRGIDEFVVESIDMNRSDETEPKLDVVDPKTFAEQAYNQITSSNFTLWLINRKNLLIITKFEKKEEQDKLLMPHISNVLSTFIDIKYIMYIMVVKREGSQVCMNKLDKSIKLNFSKFTGTGMIQMWHYLEFMSNPSTHCLVPRHEIMSDEDVAELMLKYNITNKKRIPVILLHDTMARYINAKVGDIIRITANFQRTGNIVSYRYVSKTEI